MRNTLSEVKTAVQNMETPNLQSMKLHKSGFFPLLRLWIRLEFVLVKNPVIFGLGLTMIFGCIFGKTKFVMCSLFALFSGIPIFFPVEEEEEEAKKSQFMEVLPLTEPRELNASIHWNGATIESIRRIVLQRIRGFRNRIRRVPKIVFLFVFLVSEFCRTSVHTESRSIEFVMFFLPLLCLFFILFDISFNE